MKKILFLTAYTTHSKIAFRYTQRLAQHFGAEITLVHVYEPANPMLATDPGFLGLAKGKEQKEWAEAIWAKELEKLESFAEEMGEEQYEEISLDFIVTDGEVVDEVLLIQQRNSFDLVVMGMRKHNLSEQLFGNITYRILEEISCPIFLVPPNAHYMGIDKIIYSTAFQLGDIQAIEFLLDWCLAFSSSLELLHVHPVLSIQEANARMKALVENFERETNAGIISFQLLSGKILEMIEKHVSFSDADVLVIHHRKKGFWQRIKEGDLTKILTEEVDIPLLVLKGTF